MTIWSLGAINTQKMANIGPNAVNRQPKNNGNMRVQSQR